MTTRPERWVRIAARRRDASDATACSVGRSRSQRESSAWPRNRAGRRHQVALA